ncbi:hypothetical protein KC324_g6 [Hortaea werneckii]|nr:hypothetical protein KC324_g6 [Hortaea werneckii]
MSLCLGDEAPAPLTAYFLAAYHAFFRPSPASHYWIFFFFFFFPLLRSLPHKAHPLLSVIMPRRETRKRFGRKCPFLWRTDTSGESVRFFPAVSLFSPALALTGFSRAWGRKGRYSGNEVSSPASLGGKGCSSCRFLAGWKSVFSSLPHGRTEQWKRSQALGRSYRSVLRRGTLGFLGDGATEIGLGRQVRKGNGKGKERKMEKEKSTVHGRLRGALKEPPAPPRPSLLPSVPFPALLVLLLPSLLRQELQHVLGEDGVGMACHVTCIEPAGKKARLGGGGGEGRQKKEREHTKTHPKAGTHTSPDRYPRKVDRTHGSNPSASLNHPTIVAFGSFSPSSRSTFPGVRSKGGKRLEQGHLQILIEVRKRHPRGDQLPVGGIIDVVDPHPDRHERIVFVRDLSCVSHVFGSVIRAAFGCRGLVLHDLVRQERGGWEGEVLAVAYEAEESPKAIRWVVDCQLKGWW